MMAVFDGHGPQGHSVSRNVAASLPKLLCSSALLPVHAHREALLMALPQCNQQLRR
jgi:serine/threonine protein phosphatase PrpC